MITQTTTKELKDVLLDAKSAKKSFAYHRQMASFAYLTITAEDSEENLTVINPGKNGIEFNKTMGFVHKFPGVLIYRCILGQGIILIQNNDETGEAKEVKLNSLRSGVEVEVPTGYAHAIINTGRGILVTIDNGPKQDKFIDNKLIREKHGLAYYVVDRRGDIAFEKNPHYNFHPQITIY